jgi:hypothetical protein
MTETNTKYNWNDLAEKGKNYEEIRTALHALELHCVGLTKEEVYSKDSTLRDEFKQDLETKLTIIFEESSLEETEVNSMKKNFLSNLNKKFDLVVLKKAFAQIAFSQYPLFKLFEALNTFVDKHSLTCQRAKSK